MPLTITVPTVELYDPVQKRFISIKQKTLTFEHSLLSISKWEAKWHKPYMSKAPKTEEEMRDYIRCMCLEKDVDPNVFYALDKKSVQAIAEYIQDPMTGTTFKKKDRKPSKEIVTNELVYYWMTELNIPFEPCQKWHFNHLMTLIEVASLKKQPAKKLSKKDQQDAIKRMAAENERRRAMFHTSG